MIEEAQDVFGKQPAIIQSVPSPDAALPPPYTPAEFSEASKASSEYEDLRLRVSSLENRFHAFCEHIGNKLGIRVPE